MRTHPIHILSAAITAGIALSSARAAAQQVVITEVTYEHSAETTTDSHYRVDPLPGTPANLRAPIDYAAGETYVRLEVFTKPSDAATRFQICFEATPTYACTDQSPPYTAPGVYTWGTPFSRFYQGNLVDWSRGIGRIAIILKDTNNVKPAPENVGEEVSRRYMPTRVRVTVTLVPPGTTYVPPDASEPDAGAGEDAGARGGDAGAPDASAIPALDAGPSERDAGPGDIDAGVARDAGGSDDDDAQLVGGCSAAHASQSAPIAIALFAMLGVALRSRHRR